MKSLQEQLGGIKKLIIKKHSEPLKKKGKKRQKFKTKIDSKRVKTETRRNPKDFTKCPYCKVELKKKNLKKHIRKKHPKLLSIADKNTIVRTNRAQFNRAKHKKNKLSLKSKQALLARINQGRYDSTKELLTLMKHAEKREEQEILKAVQQRLKIVSPDMYRRLVGPLHLRDPLGSKRCYCAIPTSIEEIANDIMSRAISRQSLLCDACWNIDISYAWGVYGAYGKKIIPTEAWKDLCYERGENKFSNY